MFFGKKLLWQYFQIIVIVESAFSSCKNKNKKDKYRPNAIHGIVAITNVH